MQITLNKDQWVEMVQLRAYLLGELTELERKIEYRESMVDIRHTELTAWLDVLGQLIPSKPPRQ